MDVLVQGVSFCVDLFHLEIAGADAVFGVAWMKSLGRVLTDYDLLTIEFHLGGKHTTLCDENLLREQPLKARSIKKLVHSEAITSICQLQLSLPAGTGVQQSLPLVMQQLLDQFASVFQEPQALPPFRDVDHCIELKPGSSPVNIKLYKYPHFQKSEIE